jgi:pyruvate kinase
MESIREDEARVRYQSIIEETDVSKRRTKIICTLGPAVVGEEKLLEILDAGMDTARLNFSHGDHKVSEITADTW